LRRTGGPKFGVVRDVYITLYALQIPRYSPVKSREIKLFM
jgi:hypothetical protein